MSFPRRATRTLNQLAVSASSVALTGTATPTITETSVATDGTKTLIFTFTGVSLVASGAAFDAERQAFINGSDGSDSDPAGWDAVVRATEAVTAIARTSDNVLTWTISAFGTFDISANSTVLFTVPGSILTSGVAMVVPTTLSVTAVAAAGFKSRYYYDMITPGRAA